MLAVYLIFTLLTCLEGSALLAAPKSLAQTTSTNLKDPQTKASSSWQEWLKHYIRGLNFKGHLEVWALFSEGGFHGAGEGHKIVIIKDHKTKEAELVVIDPMPFPPAGQDVPYRRLNLASDAVQAFIAAEKHFPSHDFHLEGVFDHYHYTYCHYRFNHKEQLAFKQLAMDAPHLAAKSASAHQKLLEAFQNLAGKP